MAYGQLMNIATDKRVGKKPLAPLQNNQAANAVSPLTMRNTNLSTGLPPIAAAGTPKPMVRPANDPSAVAGKPATPPNATLFSKALPQPATSLSSPTPSTLPNTPSMPNIAPKNPAMATGNPGSISQPWETPDQRLLGENHSVFSDQYNYQPPSADPRTNATLDNLAKGTNINVVNPNAPQVGKRFDEAQANLTNQPSITDQTKANIAGFGSGVTIGNTGGPGYALPDRGTPLLDKFGNMVGTNNPAAPGQVAGVGGPLGGQVGVQDSATAGAATSGQMDVAKTLAANAGLLTDQQLNQYLNPYEQKANRIAQESMQQGKGYLNKIGAGGNVDAFSKLTSDVATRRMEDVGGRFSELMKQNLAQRPEMLNAAGSQYSNVAGRENEQSLNKAKVGLENRGQDITQRGQDITQRAQDVEQRSQDIGVQQANADRLSKEMLGFAGLDVNKYQTDKGFDADMMKADIQKQLESRGLDQKEAQFKADEFARAYQRSFETAGADTQNRQFMADLALKADQGDVQSMLTHSNLLLQQAVQSGQLTNDQSKMLLDNLMQYWQNPQEMALKWRALQDQYDLQRRDLAQQHEKNNQKKGLFGTGIGIGWSPKGGLNVNAGGQY